MSLNRRNPAIEIDHVTLDHCGGVIGMTFCPGRRVSFGIGVEWDRDLDEDLQVIRDWGAGTLVSLMEKEEMAFYEVAEIPKKTVELGMQHLHLPIVDMDIPDAQFEQQWQTAGKQLRNALLSGESIVIHCLGGLGRTGTIAGRLLIELGTDPETAIQRIRQARPGTIQTIIQEAYVRRCKRMSG